jgi:hypothetical protein
MEMRFRPGLVEADQIQLVTDKVLAEMRDPTSESAKTARSVGLTTDQIAELSNAQITVKEEGQGIEPVTIAVAIAAPVAAHIIGKFWDDVIWPRLRRDKGGTALGPKIPPGR